MFVSLSMFAQDNSKAKDQISETLDRWHQAAASANAETYFNLMTNDAIFIGTDADENWEREDFEAYAMPHFNKGKAWDFTAVERHIFMNESEDLAWFDELLDTQMGICRGSGVLVLKDGHWKIKHYVLSITVPNENVSTLIDLKKSHDNDQLKQLKEDFKKSND